ncbi:hypothetical protein B0H63DRAFT_233495 [Podospora didyma]|uniref:C2H2-type domain-containing protein n=1 Tax=Podospora didyma TaxID=330526 RepID=A0AAE0NBW6_9PEZI|nr:hypothetical protein B0H63DRAFT_233495 [Podospora didyma]
MNASMASYESRQGTTAPLERSIMAPHFFTSTSFSAAPLATIPAPELEQQAGTYGAYASYNSSPTLGSPFRQQQFMERPELSVLASEAVSGRGFRYPRDSRSSLDETPSPSVKVESETSTVKPSISNPPTPSRTFTPNSLVNGGNQVMFNTPLDALMKTIQAKAEVGSTVDTSENGQDPIKTQVKIEQRPPTFPTERDLGMQLRDERLNPKRFSCNIPGCFKRFHQKTHLDIHRRAHTGERPYVCDFPNCGERFTQLGNLKTHERRHTGTKPYKCDICDKRFAQRGNVKAHQQVHDKIKPFRCRLDNCSKSFTLLGNLKSHQNKFHVDTVRALTTKFASLENYDEVSRDDMELLKYFASLYKNSNKGIKGRGKHRRVETLPLLSPISPGSATVQESVFSLPTLPSYYLGLPHLHHTSNTSTSHIPFHGLSHPAAYSFSRPSIVLNIGARESNSNYEMFDTDSVTSTSHTSSTSTGPVSDDDSNREQLAFADRY